MKKQKQRKCGTKTQRDEYRQLSKMFGYNKHHSNIPLKSQTYYQFPRLIIKNNYANSKSFEKAGYFGVNLNDYIKWTEVHTWLSNNIKTYCWCGAIFWFENKKDRELFSSQFKLAEFYN